MFSFVAHSLLWLVLSVRVDQLWPFSIDSATHIVNREEGVLSGAKHGGDKEKERDSLHERTDDNKKRKRNQTK